MQVPVQVSLPLEVAMELEGLLKKLQERHEFWVRAAGDDRSLAQARRELAKALTINNLVRTMMAMGRAALLSAPVAEIFEVLSETAVVRGRPRVR